MHVFEKLRPSSLRRKEIVLLGAGGIGSNFIRYASRELYKLHVYENDTIELSNLNRTSLFHISDIGSTKNDGIRKALGKITRWNRGQTYYYSRYVDKTTQFNTNTPPLIVDCRDTIDQSLLPPDVWIKASYDGGSRLTWYFHPNEVYKYIWTLNNNDGTYDITPSFYVPAALSGVLIRMLMSFDQFVKLDISKAKAVNLDIDTILNSITREVE
jgi:hypothetical protein